MGQGRGQRPGARRRLPRMAVMLAGWLNPPPLRRALGIPVLALPLGKRGTLLDCWLEAFSRVRSIQQVRVIVNTEDDVRMVSAAATPPHTGDVASGSTLEVLPEPQAWRGPAGLLRDVTSDLEDEDVILVSETSCLPPRALRPLIEMMKDEHIHGAIGVGRVEGGLKPAGVHAFTVRALRVAPAIGYFDLKEQLLPALHDRSWAVMPAMLEQYNGRIRDLEGYLHAVRLTLQDGAEKDVQRVAATAAVSGTAVLEGPCIVEEGAVIEDGAVVHESVVMSGATIGGGAVVSRSVIGPLARVRPREQVVREIRSRKGALKTPGESRHVTQASVKEMASAARAGNG